MTKPRAFDLSVYFIVDPDLCLGRDISSVVAASMRGGATLVQLRNKTGNKNQFLEQAKILKNILAGQVPLIINDDIEIAKAVGADGVHLGQGDAPPQQARQILGAGAIIGQTAFKESHFIKINPAIVDYAGTGPFYPTKTDKGKPVLGAMGFTSLVKISPVPVVGIGGITSENAGSVIDAGASGVAVMRDISQAADPEIATRRIALAVKNFRLKEAS